MTRHNDIITGAENYQSDDDIITGDDDNITGAENYQGDIDNIVRDDDNEYLNYPEWRREAEANQIWRYLTTFAEEEGAKFGINNPRYEASRDGLSPDLTLFASVDRGIELAASWWKGYRSTELGELLSQN
jgi:hypothetical protein